MRTRLGGALFAYGILIAIACFTLTGKVLGFVLILFGGLLAKTLISLKSDP